MVKISVRRNLEISTAKEAARKNHASVNARNSMYSFIGLPCFTPPKQAGHNCRRVRAHSDHVKSTGDPTGVEVEDKGKRGARARSGWVE